MKTKYAFMIIMGGLLIMFVLFGSFILYYNVVNYNNTNAVVGAYQTHNWNGGIGTLVLYDSGKCDYPSHRNDNDTWELKGDKVYIYKDDVVYTANVIDNALMLHGKLFIKVN